MKLSLLSFFLPAKFFAAFGCGFSSSESSQTSQQSSVANDNRIGVGDSGVLAQQGATVDQSISDNRVFDDHSQFTNITRDSGNTTTNSTAIDARNLSDNSSFSNVVRDSGNTTTSTSSTANDNRDFSDHSSLTANDNRNLSSSDSSVHTSTVYAADADVLKATATGAFNSANLVTTQSAALFEAALKFGDASLARAETAQKNSFQLANSAAEIVANNAKNPDQANTEKLIKAGVAIFGLITGGITLYALTKGKAA